VLQIATAEHVYLFQLTAFGLGKPSEQPPLEERVRSALPTLEPIFSEPSIRKCGVGVRLRF
jgi:hypothetical protein